MNFQLIVLFFEFPSASTDSTLPATSLIFFFNKHLAVLSLFSFVSYILDKILLPTQQNCAVMKATVRCI